MPRILLRTISPRKKVFDYAKFEREIKDEMARGVKPDVVKELEGTTHGWENKPEFGTRLTVRTDSIKLDAFAQGPNKDQYNLVSKGARPHIIRPKKTSGMLVFQPGYAAATRPKSLSSRSKRRFGTPVSAKVVRHPGFEGRGFYGQVAEMYKPEYERRIKNALQRATRAHQRAN